MSNILMIADALIPSTLLCGYYQLSVLDKNGKINFKFCREDAVNIEVFAWADVVIFMRSCSSRAVSIAKLARQMGRRCVYMLDDDLPAIPKSIPASTYYGSNKVHKAIWGMMGMCDSLMSPSKTLLGKYGSQFEESYQILEPVAHIAESISHDSEQVVVGIAGSLDRAGGVNEILAEALIEIKQRFGSAVAFEFFGASKELADSLNATFIQPVSSYEEYLSCLEHRNWDIGLAPMPNDGFHSCKHYIKFLEYSGCGTASICSNCVPYTEFVQDGATGILVGNTTEAWVDAISELIEDEGKRKAIALGAYTAVEKQRSVAATAQHLLAECVDLLTYQAPLISQTEQERLSELEDCFAPMLVSSSKKRRRYQIKTSALRLKSALGKCWRGVLTAKRYGIRFALTKLKGA